MIRNLPRKSQDHEGFHVDELEIQHKEIRKEAFTPSSRFGLRRNSHKNPENSDQPQSQARRPADPNKPKVILKEIRLRKVPFEVDNHTQQTHDSEQSDKPTRGAQHVQGWTTLYDKYVSGTDYSCVYHRYSRGRLTQSETKRVFTSQGFASYFIDLSFLQDPSNTSARNIEECSSQTLLEQGVDDIRFDSRFQCGNLLAVFKVLTFIVYLNCMNNK